VLPGGFRPVFGFGYEAVSKREPRIPISGVRFGQTGPFSDRPAMDPVLQAFTGLMIDNKARTASPPRAFRRHRADRA
jgi:crotonobetainyl-CoA:carnitine CoA-transferase CaiB-like acyl-CoA transferase